MHREWRGLEHKHPPFVHVGRGIDTSKYARIKVPFYVFCNISTYKDLVSFLLKPINSEMHHLLGNILK